MGQSPWSAPADSLLRPVRFDERGRLDESGHRRSEREVDAELDVVRQPVLDLREEFGREETLGRSVRVQRNDRHEIDVLLDLTGALGVGVDSVGERQGLGRRPGPGRRDQKCGERQPGVHHWERDICGARTQSFVVAAE